MPGASRRRRLSSGWLGLLSSTRRVLVTALKITSNAGVSATHSTEESTPPMPEYSAIYSDSMRLEELMRPTAKVVTMLDMPTTSPAKSTVRRVCRFLSTLSATVPDTSELMTTV